MSRPGEPHPAETTRKVGGEMTQTIAAEAEAPAIAVGTDCESRSWSRCLDRSSKHGDFDNSCCAALSREGRVRADLHRPQHNKARQGDLEGACLKSSRRPYAIWTGS